MSVLPADAAAPAPRWRFVLVLLVALVLAVSPSTARATAASPPSAPPAHVIANHSEAAGVSGADWIWPVEGRMVILRPFEAPPTPYASGHRGIDIAAAVGAVVRAPAAGVVAFAGWVVDRPVLTIAHDGGLRSSYEAVEAIVSVGDAVAAGDPVGVVVDGPHCGAGCLHVGVRLDGEYVNPMALFGEVPRAVLLPTG